MRSCCLPATQCAGMLLVLSLSATLLPAQEPVVATQKAAAQSQPAAPQAYQFDVKNVLGYQVVMTTRIGASLPTTAKFKEMVVFDIEGDGTLVVYVGSPNLKPAAPTPVAPVIPTPRTTERRAPEHKAPVQAQVQAPERKPAEEPEKAHMTWTRHVLGKSFTRNADGTVTFRPPQGEVMPYPVLPLPPTELKEKERFELTVPDLVLGEGKTVTVTGTYKVSSDGKLTVDGHMEPKVVPGSMPELAVVGYDVPAAGTVVSGIRMTRRLASEPASQPVEAPRPQHGDRGERNARSATLPPPQPTTSVLIQLATTKAIADDVHKGLITTINSTLHTGESAPEAPAGEVGEKNKPATGNVLDMVEQTNTQLKEKTEGAIK
jgi:hypothetical protein